LEKAARERDSRLQLFKLFKSHLHLESCTLGIVHKAAGKTQLNLNITSRPIANKYCEGKLKRISKEKSKEPEIA